MTVRLTASAVVMAGAMSTTALAESESGGLEEITVTAQRRAEPLHNVPLSITAQTGDDLALKGITKITELGVAVPGLSFTTQGAWAEPSIRGVQTGISQPGADSPIAIYVDGFYQPNQVGNVFDLPDVERVEVLKGPQGTLFGRNATGGAIAVHTVDPSVDVMKGHLTVSDGEFFGDNVHSANDITVKGYFSTPIVNDKLAILVSGYENYTKGYLTNDETGGGAGRVKSYLLRTKVLYVPADGIRFTLGGFYGKQDDAAASYLFPLDGNTQAQAWPDPNRAIPTQPWHTASELHGGSSFVQSNRRGVNLKSEFELGSWGTLTSLTGWQNVNALVVVDTDASYDPTCLAIGGCVTPYVVDFGPDKTIQQEFSFTSKQFNRFSFVSGAFLYWDDHHLMTNVNPPIGPGGYVDFSQLGFFSTDAIVKTRAWALFGEMNVDVAPKLLAILGLRYSVEKKTGVGSGEFSGFPTFGPNASFGGNPKWSAVTPRFSLRYSFNDEANVYTTYSRGFKSGILDATSFSPTPVNPERLDSYEVGAKIATRRYSANLSTFYYNYKDLQIQIFEGLTTILRNATTAELYGVEFDGTVRPTDEFELRAAASFLPHANFGTFTGAPGFELPLGPGGLTAVPPPGLDASGTRLLKAPKITGSMTGSYTKDLAPGQLETSLTVYYSSSYDWEFTRRVSTRPYALLNGQVAFTPKNRSSFTLTLWGKNLTNKAYIASTVLSNGSDGVGFAPPREVGLSVDYRF